MSSQSDRRRVEFADLSRVAAGCFRSDVFQLPIAAYRCLAVATLVLLLLLPVSARATIYSVGSGSDCTHISLSSALAAAVADASVGPHTIRIVQGTRVISDYEIDNPLQDIFIVGGFTTCSSVIPGAGQRTTLSANNVAGRRLFRITNNIANPRRTITLSRLTLTGGLNPNVLLNWGGALYITGRVTVLLQNETFVDGNTAQNGGGIALVNSTADTNLETRLRLSGGSRVCENTAAGPGVFANGGGIYALDGTRITIWDGMICGNQARRFGGGIYLGSQNARLDFDPIGFEEVVFTGNTAGGAAFNANEGYGGAIYSFRGNIAYETGSTSPTRFSLRLTGNNANFGGAIYAEGSPAAGAPFTTIELRNAAIHGNAARGKGGVMHLKNAVDLRLVKWGAGTCTLFGNPWPCVDVFSNQANNESFSSSFGGGGVAYLEHDASAQRPAFRAAGALFDVNRDPNGTAAVIDANGNSSVRILRSIFRNNSAGGSATLRAMIESRNDTLFAYNTVLSNSVTRLFYQGDGTVINVTGSILHSPGAAFLGATGSLSHSGCLLAHTATGLPPGGLQVGPPELSVGFAPRPRSRAVDNCDVPISDVFYPGSLDGYGFAVPVDIPSVPDSPWGPYDLGAVEQRDVLFYNGFGTRPNH